ncbi:MAG TPA: hypothetical protein PKW95_13810 [bacterium]|nr:hypothetical protein [bacterium]
MLYRDSSIHEKDLSIAGRSSADDRRKIVFRLELANGDLVPHRTNRRPFRFSTNPDNAPLAPSVPRRLFNLIDDSKKG